MVFPIHGVAGWCFQDGPWSASMRGRGWLTVGGRCTDSWGRARLETHFNTQLLTHHSPASAKPQPCCPHHDHQQGKQATGRLDMLSSSLGAAWDGNVGERRSKGRRGGEVPVHGKSHINIPVQGSSSDPAHKCKGAPGRGTGAVSSAGTMYIVGGAESH